MSANAHLLEAQVRHQVYLLRRGAGISNEVAPQVQDAIDRAIVIVTGAGESLSARLTATRELSAILAEVYGDMAEAAIGLIAEVGEYEAEFQAGLLTQVSTAPVAAPAVGVAGAAALSEQMELDGVGMTIREAFSQFGDKKARQITQTISDGVTMELTTPQIVRNIEALGITNRNQIDSLVRTATASAASAGKRVAYAANADLLKGEKYVATLDSRTTQQCMGLDGREYALNEGPYPPVHFRCRSVRIPLLKDEYQVQGFEGQRPSKGADGVELEGARTTMNSWLRRQPESFQASFFDKFPQGEEKLKLFRAGKLNAQKFVDPSGAALTMDELRARYPDAAEAAGLT